MNNYECYIKGMEKSMQEKLFFLEYLDLDNNKVFVYKEKYSCGDHIVTMNNKGPRFVDK